MPRSGKRLRLLATDTDSFIMELETNNIKEDRDALKNHIYFSNLSKENPLFDLSNKKVPGKFKLEYVEANITLFIGLRSKCYYIEVLDGKIIKRAKGMKKSVVGKTLEMKDYEERFETKTYLQTQVSRTNHI